jgi:hypothetical protein
MTRLTRSGCDMCAQGDGGPLCARVGAGTGSVAATSGGIEGGAGGGRTQQRKWCREGGWLWFTVARLLCAQVRQRARGAAGGAYDWLVHVIFREKYRPDWIASGAGDVEVRDVGEGADTSMPGCGR